MIAVALIDYYGAGVDLIPIAHALEAQVQQHFAPVYGASCTVGVASSSAVPTGAQVIGLFRVADQPGVLGDHDLTPAGLPLAKVFPELDKQDGANLSTTISHELLEMLADPFLRLAVQDASGTFWAHEVCDAVEADEYEVGGVKVSNFVLPAWYGAESGKLDYLGLCKSTLEVRPGGYAQKFLPGGWQQVQNFERAPRSYRLTIPGRTTRRALLRAA